MPTFSQNEVTGNYNTVYQHIPNIADIPEKQRIYGVTNEILKITPSKVNTVRVMMEKAKKGVAVDDMHFKYKSEMPREVLIPIQSSTTATDKVTISMDVLNKYVPFLEVGTVLLCRGLYFGNSNWSSTPTTGRTQREAIKITEIQAPGSTTTVVKGIRAWKPADGTTPTGTPPEFGGTGVDSYVLIQPKPQPLGSNEGKIYGDTPIEEFNYCEPTFEKWGVDRVSESIKIRQNESISERNGRRQLAAFWKKVAIQRLFGRRNYYINSENRPVYETGGIDEYIETGNPDLNYVAQDHVIDFYNTYGPLSYASLVDFGKDKFYYGSEKKWWIMDKNDYTAISTIFDNKIRIQYERDMSIQYGFEIESLKISGGGTFYLVQDEIFSLYGVTGTSYIIDFDYFEFVPLKGWDFQIMVDVEKGINPFEKVNYLYMISGNKRTNPHAHYKVFNLVT